jgi:hypothetical protein
MIASYFGHPQDPASLNALCTKNKIYVSLDLMPDDGLATAFSDIKYVQTFNYVSVAADLNNLKNIMADPTQIVVLEVDFNHNPADGIQTHFVVCTDCDGSNVTIADPWFGTVDNFTKNYGTNPAQTIVKFVVYKGTPVQGNVYKGLDLSNADSMKVAVDMWDAVVNQHQYVAVGDVTATMNAIALILGLPNGSTKDAITAAIMALQKAMTDAETKVVALTAAALATPAPVIPTPVVPIPAPITPTVETTPLPAPVVVTTSVAEPIPPTIPAPVAQPTPVSFFVWLKSLFGL